MRLFFAPLLGLRLLRGQGRTGLLRIILMVGGTALGVVLLLIALSVQPVLHARDARLAARTPVCDHGSECGFGTEVDGSFLGNGYVEQLVDVPAGTPAPAGLSRLPRPGEIVLSPALRRLATRPGHELLRQRLPGSIVGTIGDSGLLQPDELLAYVGVAHLDNPQHQGRIIGYGGKVGLQAASVPAGTSSANTDPNLRGRLDPRKVTIDVTSVVLLVPVLLFLATCARLSARTRDRRLASLRLVGMTPWQVRIVNAVETGAAAIMGSLLGLAVFELLRSPLSTLQLDGNGWFAVDATPSTGHVVELLFAIPLLAVVVGTLAVRNLTGVLLSSRTAASARRLRLWRLLPLAAGAALLGLADVRHLKGGPAIETMGGGLLLTLVGLAVATPLLAQLIAGALARLTGSLSVLLGARRIQTEATGVSRVVTGLVLLVFAGGFAQSTLLAVKAGVVADANRWGVGLRSAIVTAPSENVDGRLLPSSTWSGIPGVTAVLSLRHLDAPPQDTSVDGITTSSSTATAIVARCSDLDVLLSAPPIGCREGTAYRVPDDERGQLQGIPASTRLQLVDRGTVRQDTDRDTGKLLHPVKAITVLAPADTLQLPQPDSFSNTLGAQIVLPPSDPALAALPAGPPDGYYLVTDGSARTVEAIRTAAARIDPTLAVSTAAELAAQTNDVEGYHFPLYAELIGWGTALALLVAFASVAVATIDRAVERRRHVAMQTAIGVPASTVRRAQLVQVLLPYSVGILCATVLSVLAGAAYAHLTRPELPAQIPAEQVLVTMAVALAGAVVVALSVLPSLGRPLTSDLLRQE